MPFELRIALRYLKARRKQAFISIISGVSVLGVGVGVTALMISLGLMTGLQGEIRSRILGSTAHVSIHPSGEVALTNHAEVAEKVRKNRHVLGAAPAVYGKGLITSAAGGKASVTVKGIDIALEPTVTDIAQQIEDGGSLAVLEADDEGPPPILLGRDLAAALGVGSGQVVQIWSTHTRLSPMGAIPRVKSFRVAGTVNSGLWEFDSEWAYLSLPVAQRLFGMGESVSLVELRVDDMYAAREVGDEVVESLGRGYVTNDWIRMNQSLFAALWLEKVAIGITIGLIVMVAALNIVATLILMVMEKSQDIAILVSMGAARGMIARIFMLQGTIIGAVGTIAGGFLGWLACFILDHYRLIQVPADVYQVSYVPFKLQVEDATLVIVGALLVCFFATIYPARGAARLDPAEALRAE
jgi:lipoprotein-releasing system permease protein